MTVTRMNFLRIAALTSLACPLCFAAGNTVLTGTALGCGNHSSVPTPGMEIFVFATSSQLSALIGSFERATDDNIFDRYEKLTKHVKGTKPLARTRSLRDGSFKVDIPSVASVTVVGYMELEDDPLFLVHAEAEIRQRPVVAVALNECRNK